jgi:hypothetical protein
VSPESRINISKKTAEAGHRGSETSTGDDLLVAVDLAVLKGVLARMADLAERGVR